MICPKCGEDNSANFRYCGMCGAALEPRRPAGSPRVSGASEGARSTQVGSPGSPASNVSNTVIAADHAVPSTAGPSFLGLNDAPVETSGGMPPSAEELRDQFFSNAPTFYEPEEPNIGARRIVLLLVLVAILGAAGWWTYSNYGKMHIAKRNPPGADTTPDATGAAGNDSAPGAKSPADTSSQDGSASRQVTTIPTQPPQTQSSDAGQDAQPKATEKAENTNLQQDNEAKAVEPSRASRHASIARAARTPPPRPKPTVIADDKGDAEFKRGEAYLYGRGMPENCAEAIRNLKAASAKQNAKARSAFGTMYATGHCAPRDLPTSYTWFASALRADPNNQTIEKDLVALWNEMTPPERQMATKSKGQ